MGRKKSKRKAPAKKKQSKLATTFDCPFCNHNMSCDVTIDKGRNIGVIRCRVCQESFQTETNYLSEPIDVYADWIDACEESNAREDDPDPQNPYGNDDHIDDNGRDDDDDDDELPIL